MKRIVLALITAVALAGCADARDAARNIEVWKDPERPVVCYVVSQWSTVEASCVVVPE